MDFTEAAHREEHARWGHHQITKQEWEQLMAALDDLTAVVTSVDSNTQALTALVTQAVADLSANAGSVPAADVETAVASLGTANTSITDAITALTNAGVTVPAPPADVPPADAPPAA